jgi:acetyltransferase-like isoleucine patch superfamily enzyme
VEFRHLGANVHIYEYCTILKPEMISLADGVRIDAFVKIAGGEGVSIGKNCHVSSFSHINAGSGTVIMGDHSGCASHTIICGGMTDMGMFVTTPQDGNVAKRMITTIGKYVLIFAGAIILPGLTLGDHCVIGAGSIVTKDIPSFEVWAGSPAKFIKRREITK